MFTLRQAIGYVRNLADNNTGVNFDGWYGWQCWDLVAKVILSDIYRIILQGNFETEARNLAMRQR